MKPTVQGGLLVAGYLVLPALAIGAVKVLGSAIVRQAILAAVKAATG